MPTKRKVQGATLLNQKPKSQVPLPAAEAVTSQELPEQESDAQNENGLDQGTVETQDLMIYIEAFFSFIYPSPSMGFLHQTLFIQSYEKGECPLPLLQVVCGAASLFLPGKDHRECGKSWIEEAERSLLQKLEDPTLVNIQVILILIFYFSATRQLRKVMVYLSLGVRLAYLSQLNYEHQTFSAAVRETRRRLMWALYVQDKFYSAGLPDFTLCAPETIHINLPCTEVDFALELDTETERLVPRADKISSVKLGPLAYYIKLLDIRNRVLRYTRKLIIAGVPPPELQRQFEEFDHELEHFHRMLPEEFQFGERTMVLHAHSPFRRTIIMIEIWWHQCFCDLYRIVFENFREAVADTILNTIPESYIYSCRKRAFNHAMKLVGIFETISKLGSRGQYIVTESYLGTNAYQCARIISHAKQLSPDDNVIADEEIIRSLTICHDVLTELRGVYTYFHNIQNDISKMIASSQARINGDYSSMEPRRETSPEQEHVGTLSAIHGKILSKHGFVDAISSGSGAEPICKATEAGASGQVPDNMGENLAQLDNWDQTWMRGWIDPLTMGEFDYSFDDIIGA
ncbi:hypothetical protein BP6252_02794 [Coleophoma cylindrospora]|uniref:Xylanolytic transcriptional activator regulatory domain-containing protein n=1 Tax=Coleophoma cylindrospora TaxID=1849047 RepID=A0A3D8SGC7_9HELO|nr:hypothetical protein BP6252_02794 [Coleophoma cylindrospora]